uniref:Dynein light chain n=1 Tax=Oryza glumipatula TaxID=40148 RepID=A0A0D9YU41_9ORYZ
MDPASEELEQRSRYLSSLIRRTKLHAAPALTPPPPTPPPEPETKLQLEMEPQPERVEEAAKKPAAVAAVVEKREVKGGGGGGGQAGKGKGKEKEMEKGKEERKVSVRVRAADMPLAMQRRAVRLAFDAVAAMPRLDSKRLALALKKEFDATYGPAWHCIVGTGFGSYVTHSVGGFLYFSVDKVYVLLFRTAVEPLGHPQ